MPGVSSQQSITREIERRGVASGASQRGLCPTETLHTMELGSMLTWHSECGAGIERVYMVGTEMNGHLSLRTASLFMNIEITREDV